MRLVTVRCYGSLNDFLAPAHRGVSFEQVLHGRPAARDFIEALGIPHPEVELVLLDGEPGSLERPLETGTRLSLYPHMEALELPPELRARPPPSEPLRFVADVGLGKLADYLRMLGFDTLWRNDAADAWLAEMSASEERILLTRDLGLLKRRVVQHGYFPRHTAPESQLIEMVQRFSLTTRMQPFTRCMACNGSLEVVSPEAIRARVPPRVASSFRDFQACHQCARVYWQGSHHARMQRLVGRLSRIGLTAE